MKKLLNISLKRFTLFAAILLICSIPVYYYIIRKLWAYELGEHNIVLTSEAAKEDSFLIILSITSLTLLFFILQLVGFVLINRRVSRILWKPFYDSIEKIRNFDLTKQESIDFNSTEVLEFTELNQSLDKLFLGNRSAYVQQKEFAENASHELQTPLAIIQSKIDILLQNKDLTDLQYQLLDEMQSALSRVSRINKNLLLLSKIENNQFLEVAALDISALLKEKITVFDNFIQEKGIQVQASIEPEILLHANDSLLIIIFNNLFTNAIRYTPRNGKLIIELSKNQLRFSNSGDVSLNRSHVFQRFGKSSDHSPGAGLGLSLVNQICKRYNWVLDYSFVNNFHLFTITF